MFVTKKILTRIENLEEAMHNLRGKEFINDLFEYQKMKPKQVYSYYNPLPKVSVIRRLDRQVNLLIEHFGLEEQHVEGTPPKDVLVKRKK